MNRRTQVIIAALAAVIVGMGVIIFVLLNRDNEQHAAAGAPAPTATSGQPARPVDASSTQQSEPPVNDGDRLQQAAWAYAFSPQREQAYDSVYTDASLRIANALIMGELGTISISAPSLDTNEGGWGSIQLTGGNGAEAHVLVYFDADGSVDLDRGVRSMGLYVGDGSPHLQIMRPEDGEPWIGFIETDEPGVTATTDISYIGGDMPPPGDYRYPASLDEIMELDRQILDVLTGIMNESFGSDWRSQ